MISWNMLISLSSWPAYFLLQGHGRFWRNNKKPNQNQTHKNSSDLDYQRTQYLGPRVRSHTGWDDLIFIQLNSKYAKQDWSVSLLSVVALWKISKTRRKSINHLIIVTLWVHPIWVVESLEWVSPPQPVCQSLDKNCFQVAPTFGASN